MKPGLALAAVAALAMIVGLSGLTEAESGGDQVLATVGDRRITESEVDARIAGQLAAVRNQIYELKKRAVDAIADDYLIEKAAKQANLSKENYLKREVEDKVPNPDEAEQQKYYDEHKAQIRQPLDKIKPQLIKFLQNRALASRRQELLAGLRSEAKMKVMLEAPRVQVSAEGSAAVGPKTAPVTIVEFSDFQCPYCRRVEGSLIELRKKYADKVRMVYRDFPLPIHQNAMKAAEAARCAEEQGKFWPYHDALFADQTKLDVADLKATAGKLGLNASKFDECLDHDKYADAIRKDTADGAALGVNGTPAFFINGRFLSGAQPTQAFEEVVQEEIALKAKK